MAKFVCPECGDNITNGRGSVINDAEEHMEDQHGKEVSRDYLQGVIDANQP